MLMRQTWSDLLVLLGAAFGLLALLAMPACTAVVDSPLDNGGASSEYSESMVPAYAKTAVQKGIPFAHCENKEGLLNSQQPLSAQLDQCEVLRSALTAKQFVELSQIEIVTGTSSVVDGKAWPRLKQYTTKADCANQDGAIAVADADAMCFAVTTYSPSKVASVVPTSTLDSTWFRDNFSSVFGAKDNPNPAWVCEKQADLLDNTFASGGLGFKTKDCARFYNKAAADALFQHASPLACTTPNATVESTLDFATKPRISQEFSHFNNDGGFSGRHLALDMVCDRLEYGKPSTIGAFGQGGVYAAGTGLINFAGPVLNADGSANKASIGVVVLELMNEYGATYAVGYMHLSTDSTRVLNERPDKLVRAGDAIASMGTLQEFKLAGFAPHVHFALMDTLESRAVISQGKGRYESYDNGRNGSGYVDAIQDALTSNLVSVATKGFYLDPAVYFFKAPLATREGQYLNFAGKTSETASF